MTKADVRTEFTYTRELLRLATATLTEKNLDIENARELANELIASATVYAEWVSEQREN